MRAAGPKKGPPPLIFASKGNHSSNSNCPCSCFVLKSDQWQRRRKLNQRSATWNPVTGCSKITRGCDLCYAERFSARFRGVPGHAFENGFDLTLRPQRLTQPLTWRTPGEFFVNSMSDLFHKDIPGSFVDIFFETMEKANWHTFQVLTKRSSLMVRYLRRRYGGGLAPEHIWMRNSLSRTSRIRFG